MLVYLPILSLRGVEGKMFKPLAYTIMIALGLTSWTTEARFVRGEFLRIREMDFAYAARASGARNTGTTSNRSTTNSTWCPP